MTYFLLRSRCDIEEEPEDEDAIMEQSATYTKLVNKQKYVMYPLNFTSVKFCAFIFYLFYFIFCEVLNKINKNKVL